MGNISCSNDNESKEENGRPHSITLLNSKGESTDKIRFYYQDNCITQIVAEKDNTTDYKYENNEITSIWSSPTDKEMADGNSVTRFSREGNKINIVTSMDPFWETYEKEIELDENDIPIKMTYKGMYFPDSEYDQEGMYYSTFKFDPKTKKLLEEEIFHFDSSTKLFTYSYKYEDTPGAFSEVNLPLWFHAYINHTLRDGSTAYKSLFINYVNNISEKNIEYIADDIVYHTKVNYTYSYNKNNFPITINARCEEVESTIRIKY